MSAIDKIIYKITQAIPAGLLFLTLLPPVLYKLGATGVAKVLYVMLGFLCHQRADRSFYLFGESLTYSKEEMISAVGFDKVFTINFSERFVCNEHFGCKFGVCSRCTGIYCGLLGGMIISEIFKGKEMPKWLLVVLAAPLALDGIVQTIAYIMSPENGFYESTNIRRFITGVLFGGGFGYHIYSQIKRDLDGEKLETISNTQTQGLTVS